MLTVVLVLWVGPIGASTDFCVSLLSGSYKSTDTNSTPRQSLSQYLDRVRSLSAHVKLPGFVNPRREIEASKTWEGVNGPAVFQAMLPLGISLISHPLNEANELGLVKSGSGSLVHLRARIGNSATNIGVSLSALGGNFARNEKHLVRDDANAVIVFIHGGGTKTTGHHVAASLMDWMNSRNVDVISLDMPWHAESPRRSYSSTKEFLEEIRSFIGQYLSPSGKPIILVGHSMGGLISDLYMRTFPNDTLIAGVAALSTVGDPLPGRSFNERTAKDDEISLANQTNPKIPAGERALGDSLARQGKISPTCGLFCQFLMYGLDWSPRPEIEANYVPAMYVIGEGDGLFQGYERSFSTGVSALRNIEFRLLGARRDWRDKEGKLGPTGHLIFDHRPLIEFSQELSEADREKILAGKISKIDFESLRESRKISLDSQFVYEDIGDPEVFVLLRNFIRKVTKRDLSKTKTTETALFETVFQTYANNLAFREFAKKHVLIQAWATQKGSLLGEEYGRLNGEVKRLSKKKREGSLTESESQNLDVAQKRVNEIGIILSNRGEVSRENLPRFQELKAKRATLIEGPINELTERQKALRVRISKAQKKLLADERILSEYSDGSRVESRSSLNSPALVLATQNREIAFSEMRASDLEVRTLSNTYLASAHRNDRFADNSFENLPPKVLKVFQRFERASQRYQQLAKEWENVFILEASLGHLEPSFQSGDNKEVSHNVQEAARDLRNSRQIAFLLQKQMDRNALELSILASQVFTIEREMLQITNGDYFKYQVYTLHDLLSVNINEARKDKGKIDNLIQKAWGDWQNVWGR